MLEIDFGDVPQETMLSAGVIIKARVHKQLIQLHGLLPRSSEHCQDFTVAICSSEPCQECMSESDISVPTLQARDSTATPPSMGSAPAGPGAAPARWCHDPARRCSTASDTTPPVSATLSTPASKKKSSNRFKTRFDLFHPSPLTRLPLGANPVYVIVCIEISPSIQISERRAHTQNKTPRVHKVGLQIIHHEVPEERSPM